MEKKLFNLLDSQTAKLIKRYSPMWTNKQVWEYEQVNQDIKFDVLYNELGKKDISWKSKLAYADSDLRNTVSRNFDHLTFISEHVPNFNSLFVFCFPNSSGR